MTRAQVALVPRDGLFCKDGRGWYTSASGRGHGLDWPWPSTILGALRTCWGRGEETRKGVLFGPEQWRAQTKALRLGTTLALRRSHADVHQNAPWRAEHIVWPVPADALWLEGCDTVQRLEPQPPDVPTLGRDDDDARESLWRPRLLKAGKPLAPPRWWNGADWTTWLGGGSVGVGRCDGLLEITRRVQVRVGIRSDEQTSDEGMLFSHDVVETLEPDGEWAIGAEVEWPDGGPFGLVTLGSDARIARLESLDAGVFEPPSDLLEAFRSASLGLRVVAVTPLGFAKGWLPDGFENDGDAYRGRLPGLDYDLVLRAAIVPRPVHVSGWDMVAGAPKPTSRMVAPGAVYFLERTDGQPFGEADARSLWLTALGSRTEEGFGRIVPGVWSPARSTP